MILPIRQFYLGLALRGLCQMELSRVCNTQVDRNSSCSAHRAIHRTSIPPLRTHGREHRESTNCIFLRVFRLSTPLRGGLVNPRIRASNEHLLSVRVPRAGGQPGRPHLPSRTGEAIPALLSAISGMFVLRSDMSRPAALVSSGSHGRTHLLINRF